MPILKESIKGLKLELAFCVFSFYLESTHTKHTAMKTNVDIPLLKQSLQFEP